MRVVRDILIYSAVVPRLVGQYDAQWGLTLDDVLDTALLLAAVWQTFTLESRPSVEDHDSE